ncbi:universal stress protein [Rhodococcus sp. I2R]|uniref:universal stress protein n=1 Tax=Rhodococcus sp. I2R TaxID=2855445 RepID=UPI001E57D409|nr:universal stress protein [Rhodococcus sp. I2R]MCC8930154.1 universal stress protein [Rhodococcus sp. I2R]
MPNLIELPIYVGIDGSDTALEACKWAAQYADSTSMSLILVYAMPDAERQLGTAATRDENLLSEEVHSVGRRVLAAAESLVDAVAPSVNVETVLTRAPIASFLASVSSNASLVVVGSEARHGLRDLVLGGEVIRISNAVECPVMVRRALEAAQTDTVLPVVVGIDYSETSRHVATTAFEYARALHAPLVVTHAWQVGTAVGIGYGACVIDWEKVRVDNERWLREFVETLREKFADVRLTVQSVEGSPARHLQHLSAKAQLVVVGSHKRSKIAGAVLGSVSQNMLHHSKCSVLLVH